MSESLEARGHMEALGSMSDDEGSDEEEEEEEEEDGEVEKGGGDQDIKDNEEEVEERQNRPDVQDQVSGSQNYFMNGPRYYRRSLLFFSLLGGHSIWPIAHSDTIAYK